MNVNAADGASNEIMMGLCLSHAKKTMSMLEQTQMWTHASH